MHLEAITSGQKRILEKLRNFSDYYLAGGTALALQIGHRLSVDFDFFSGKEIPQSLLPKTEKVFKDFRKEIIVNNPEQLTVSLNGIHLTFVKYSFPILFSLEEWRGIKLLSVPEIAATKAYVLGRRATMRDYLDLYFILKEKHLTLQRLIDICQKKYRENFEPKLFLEQLIFVEDIEEQKIRFLRGRAEIQKMLVFFEEEVRKIRL